MLEVGGHLSRQLMKELWETELFYLINIRAVIPALPTPTPSLLSLSKWYQGYCCYCKWDVKETVLGRALPLVSDILANNLCQSHPPTQILEGKSNSLLYSLPDFFPIMLRAESQPWFSRGRDVVFRMSWLSRNIYMAVGESEERTQECFILKGSKDIVGYKCCCSISDQTE